MEVRELVLEIQNVQSRKMECIKDQTYQEASDLRDEEKQLRIKLEKLVPGHVLGFKETE